MQKSLRSSLIPPLAALLKQLVHVNQVQSFVGQFERNFAIMIWEDQFIGIRIYHYGNRFKPDPIKPWNMFFFPQKCENMYNKKANQKKKQIQKQKNVFLLLDLLFFLVAFLFHIFHIFSQID